MSWIPSFVVWAVFFPYACLSLLRQMTWSYSYLECWFGINLCGVFFYPVFYGLGAVILGQIHWLLILICTKLQFLTSNQVLLADVEATCQPAFLHNFYITLDVIMIYVISADYWYDELGAWLSSSQNFQIFSFIIMKIWLLWEFFPMSKYGTLRQKGIGFLPMFIT